MYREFMNNRLNSNPRWVAVVVGSTMVTTMVATVGNGNAAAKAGTATTSTKPPTSIKASSSADRLRPDLQGLKKSVLIRRAVRARETHQFSAVITLAIPTETPVVYTVGGKVEFSGLGDTTIALPSDEKGHYLIEGDQAYYEVASDRVGIVGAKWIQIPLGADAENDDATILSLVFATPNLMVDAEDWTDKTTAKDRTSKIQRFSALVPSDPVLGIVGDAYAQTMSVEVLVTESGALAGIDWTLQPLKSPGASLTYKSRSRVTSKLKIQAPTEGVITRNDLPSGVVA